jgi:hypothetical protein
LFLLVLLSGFTVWMGVEAIRRGQASSWLWIILFFGPVGAAVYFFSEYLGGRFGRVVFRPRKVSANDLRRAEAEVRRFDSGATWVDYASLLRASRDYPRAIEAAGKAVERSPASLDARYELGLALLAAERHGEAATALEAVVAQDRNFDSGDAFYAMARAQFGAGRLEAARDSFREMESRSSRPEILYEMAGLEARLGDREAAARCLTRIIQEAELVPPYLQRNVKPWVSRARKGLRKLGY